MVAKNDITGDSIQTKAATKAYEDNYDRIFRKNKTVDDYQDILSTEDCVLEALEKITQEEKDIDPDYPDGKPQTS